MAGEAVEVTVHVAHVDWQMHRPLATVDEHRNAAGMRDPAHLLDRHDGAEDVRHVGDGDYSRPVGQELFEFVDQEGPVVGDRRPFDDGALPLTMEIPRHEVGVVFHDREDDLVALAEVHTVGSRDQVDRLGGVLGEDDLVGMRRIEEAPHDPARLLVFLRGDIG